MSHMTSEQIEMVLDGTESPPAHVAECGLCRTRYEQALAVRGRLRQAFASVDADAALKRSVTACIRSADRDRRPRAVVAAYRRIAPSLAAAAAIALVAVSLTLYVSGSRQVQAASAELAQIHQANLMPHAELYGSSDPQRMAAFMKRELGFVPAFPRLGAGMDLRGCCVAYFRNRPVGSYVMATDRGVISIIVLRDKPETLRFAGQVRREGRTYHTGAFARNKMAALEIGGLTYCAVGETDTAWLMELLHSLLSGYQDIQD